MKRIAIQSSIGWIKKGKVWRIHSQAHRCNSKCSSMYTYMGQHMVSWSIPWKQNLKRNSCHSCVMIREFQNVSGTFCGHFLVSYSLESFVCWMSETLEIHVIILLVEFLLICKSKTREININIEHHYIGTFTIIENLLCLSCVCSLWFS